VPPEPAIGSHCVLISYKSCLENLTLALCSAGKKSGKTTYILILHELDVHDQLSRLLAHTTIPQTTIRQALCLLQTDDDFAHDLELLPVDTAGFFVADESLVAFLRRHEIAAVQWDVRNAFGRAVIPREAVGLEGTRVAHEDFQFHPVLADRRRDELASRCQAMNCGSSDAGQEGAEGVVVVQFAQLACDAHHLLEHHGAVFGLVAEEDEVGDP
jgi:hypothetical protein